MDKQFESLEGLVRESYIAIMWTHKVHEKQADIYLFQFRIMEWIKIVVSALTSCGIISIVFTDQLWIKVVSAIISFSLVVINTAFKSFSTQELYMIHKNAANTLLIIRDKYRHLLLEIRTEAKPFADLDFEYIDLESEKHQAYNKSPITDKRAFKAARKALNVANDNTYTDEEIDRYLPNELRSDYKQKTKHTTQN
jgi:hypothetical protein